MKPTRTKKRNPEQPATEPYPPPFRRYVPEPARRRLPPGWKPEEEFDYLACSENIQVGTRFFARGDHVRRDDPMALKLLYECPEGWVHPVNLKKLNEKKED
jgi:hypothetical protein